MIPGLIPQKDGSWAISIELPGAQIQAQVLSVLANLAEKGAIIHPTTAQKIMILGLEEETAKHALSLLEEAGAMIRKSGKSLQPRTCVGLPYCKLALQETLRFSHALYEAFPAEDLPHKLKVGVSGCPACCSWANLLDLGFVGVRSGFKVYVGGKGGYKPTLGSYLTAVSSLEEAVSLMRGVLDFFKKYGQKKKRLGSIIEGEELAALKKHLGL